MNVYANIGRETDIEIVKSPENAFLPKFEFLDLTRQCHSFPIRSRSKHSATNSPCYMKRISTMIPSLSSLFRLALIFTIFSFITACESMKRTLNPWYDIQVAIHVAIDRYQKSMDLVDLGDSKEKFLELVYSSQEHLPLEHTRPPTKYYNDRTKVEIYFVRSALITDGYLTSNELTPYLFYNEILVAVGWPAIEEQEQ